MTETIATERLELVWLSPALVEALLIAFVGRSENEPPERPRVFKIVDENGNEREVYAPPGHVVRWRW